MKNRIQLCVLLANLLLLAAWPCRAESAKQQDFAVLSLIGDNLTVSQFSTTTGTILSQNARTMVPVKSPVFDDTALLAVDEIVKQIDPRSQVDLLSSDDPLLYKEQSGLLEPGDSAVKAALRQVLKNSAHGRLLLVTKHRADARFSLLGSQVGQGKLEGLGYYIDNTVLLKVAATGASGYGYLAPFAYLNISLLDASTLQVLKTQLITQSDLISNAGSAEEGLSAWQVISQEEKIDTTRKLIKLAVKESIPKLLNAAGGH